MDLKTDYPYSLLRKGIIGNYPSLQQHIKMGCRNNWSWHHRRTNGLAYLESRHWSRDAILTKKSGDIRNQVLELRPALQFRTDFKRTCLCWQGYRYSTPVLRIG